MNYHLSILPGSFGFRLVGIFKFNNKKNEGYVRVVTARRSSLTACLEACITSSSVADGRPYDILWKIVSLKRTCIATLP